MNLTDKESAFQGEPRLYQIIARRILRLINENRSDPDWRVPAERDLALMFDVSRPVIREAIIALEVTGVVAVKGRAGIKVLPKAATDGASQSAREDAGIASLLDARLRQEPLNGHRAADQLDKKLLEQLGELVEQMPAYDGEAFATLLVRFQLKLAEMTGDVVSVTLESSLMDMWRASSEVGMLRSHLYGPELRPRWIGDHYAILSSLRLEHPVATKNSIIRHLEGLQAEVTALRTQAQSLEVTDADPLSLATGSDSS